MNSLKNYNIKYHTLYNCTQFNKLWTFKIITKVKPCNLISRLPISKITTFGCEKENVRDLSGCD